MEIYKETNTAETKEFEKLLDNQISKTKNLVEGGITISNNFEFSKCRKVLHD